MSKFPICCITPLLRLNLAHVLRVVPNVRQFPHLSRSSLTNTIGIHSSYCKEQNLVSSKVGACIVLKGVLGLPIDEDLIEQSDLPALHPTVILAAPVRVVDDVEVESSK